MTFNNVITFINVDKISDDSDRRVILHLLVNWQIIYDKNVDKTVFS